MKENSGGVILKLWKIIDTITKKKFFSFFFYIQNKRLQNQKGQIQHPIPAIKNFICEVLHIKLTK